MGEVGLLLDAYDGKLQLNRGVVSACNGSVGFAFRSGV